MTKLSVNINKVALIRNSRGENLPDLVVFAKDCESFGAEGITLHPRPDERHARFDDLARLKAVVLTELNVEGYPGERFMAEVLSIQPHQCTLVPDAAHALTSDAGWDTVANHELLKEICTQLRSAGIRSSIFVDPDTAMVQGAFEVGADRIELYTGLYAKNFDQDREGAIAPHIACAKLAAELGMGVNAGHDLNLDNLRYYKMEVQPLDEVSIGHALISDALYFGIQNTIQMYLHELRD
ncbi:MAG: pyridoxine 5'-phosphate synthase [Saprospiraceae bacterium]